MFMKSRTIYSVRFWLPGFGATLVFFDKTPTVPQFEEAYRVQMADQMLADGRIEAELKDRVKCWTLNEDHFKTVVVEEQTVWEI